MSVLPERRGRKAVQNVDNVAKAPPFCHERPVQAARIRSTFLEAATTPVAHCVLRTAHCARARPKRRCPTAVERAPTHPAAYQHMLHIVALVASNDARPRIIMSIGRARSIPPCALSERWGHRNSRMLTPPHSASHTCYTHHISSELPFSSVSGLAGCRRSRLRPPPRHRGPAPMQRLDPRHRSAPTSPARCACRRVFVDAILFAARRTAW